MDTTITFAPIGSLRQRMLQDMKLRGLGAHTQEDYIRHVRSFVVGVVLPRADSRRPGVRFPARRR